MPRNKAISMITIHPVDWRIADIDSVEAMTWLGSESNENKKGKMSSWGAITEMMAVRITKVNFSSETAVEVERSLEVIGATARINLKMNSL